MSHHDSSSGGCLLVIVLAVGLWLLVICASYFAWQAIEAAP